MKVSAVLPLYNGASFVAEALDSVFAQTLPPDEIVVVDDCSTDASRSIAARYPVTVIVQETNGGCAAARNRGVTVSSGDVIAFIDQDDCWMPGHLERAALALEADPALDFTVSAIRNFLSPGMTALPAGVEPAMLAVPQHGMGTGTLVTRRRLFDRVGRFDPAMIPIDDSDWLLRAIDAGARFVHFDEPTLERRIHALNQSHLARGTQAHAKLMARLLHASLVRRRTTA